MCSALHLSFLFKDKNRDEKMNMPCDKDVTSKVVPSLFTAIQIISNNTVSTYVEFYGHELKSVIPIWVYNFVLLMPIFDLHQAYP